MATYRFRVKLEQDPTSLWRDVVVGEDRTLDELQTAINDAIGLDQGHLWFFGTDQDYWRSDVRYESPQEYEEGDVQAGGLFGSQREETSHNAAETTVADLSLDERDRICYLYDYGDQWRFYAICKEIDPDGGGNTPPEIVDAKGDPVEQYPPADDREYP